MSFDLEKCFGKDAAPGTDLLPLGGWHGTHLHDRTSQSVGVVRLHDQARSSRLDDSGDGATRGP
jgi:hypothetical protein